MEFHKKTKEKKGKEIINLKSIRPKAMIIQNNTPTNISNMTRYQKQINIKITEEKKFIEKQLIEEKKMLEKDLKEKINKLNEEKNIVLSSQKEENQRRQHYVFNSKGNKIPEDSKSYEISSIQNCKTLNKPNYKFYYSFGTSKPPSMNQELNINKEKKIINVPRGIASTKTMSQKTQSYIASSRTETEKSKTINIFKPVPKIIIQTLKYNHKYHKNKQEKETNLILNQQKEINNKTLIKETQKGNKKEIKEENKGKNKEEAKKENKKEIIEEKKEESKEDNNEEIQNKKTEENNRYK